MSKRRNRKRKAVDEPVMPAPAHGALVWHGLVDSVFVCTVTQTGPAVAELLVMAPDEHELLREEVGLAHGAAFGPDVADVAAWQRRCLEAIDEHLAKSAAPDAAERSTS